MNENANIENTFSQIIQHENNLRLFKDIATRWNIDIVSRDLNRFPVIRDCVINSKSYLESFSIALKNEVDKPENGKGFEIDIKDRFFPMIEEYFKWYEQNKEKTKKLELDFYEMMYCDMRFTKNEINKYFGSIRNTFNQNNATGPFIFNETLLQSFVKFDGLLWNSLDRDWFRQCPKKIQLKKECTQPVFCYFFNQFKDKRDKELCPSPTDWLPLLFTPGFNYSNQNTQIDLLTQVVNKNDKRNIAFNKSKEKIDNLVLEIEKNTVS